MDPDDLSHWQFFVELGALQVTPTSRTVISWYWASPKTKKLAIALPCLYALFKVIKHALTYKSPRYKRVPRRGERVLVIGASSGIGRSIATRYAERGARVAVVGRRTHMIEDVVSECSGIVDARNVPTGKDLAVKGSVIGFTGDFADVDDMVALRETLHSEWGGLDTVIVAAGVSALQPLLAVAGADVPGYELRPDSTDPEGIERTKHVAQRALEGNYIGPMVAALTFIPLLSATSLSPSILLLSSLASVIPAPTRTLYGSTKAAALVLYQSLSIEHPQIHFTYVLPSTVEGDFRASAVDGGPVREQDPNKSGLRREAVAKRCVQAVDRYETTVWMPPHMRFAHALYWAVPSLIEWGASRKYNFEPTTNAIEDNPHRKPRAQR